LSDKVLIQGPEIEALVRELKAQGRIPQLIGPIVMDWIAEKAPGRQYEIRIQENVEAVIHMVFGLPEPKRPTRIWTRVTKPPGPPPPRLEVVRVGRVPMKRIEWLWPDRLAIGKLSLLAGEPGMGKSMMTADMIARITTGEPWPDGGAARAPGSAMLLTTEDEIEDTIKPRLIAAGGDANQLAVVRSVRDGDARRGFNLTADLPALEAALDAMDATDYEPVRLIVIDPLSAYLGGKLDSHKNTDVRAALEPLAEMASRKRVAVLGLSHLTKSGGDRSAVGRVLGSIAFAAVARVVLFAVRDDEQEEGKPERRLLLVAKSNIGSDRRGLSYTAEERTFDYEGETYDAWRIVWSERSDKRVEDVLRENSGGGRSAGREVCAAWLAGVLRDGPKDSATVEQMAAAKGFGPSVLKAAKKQLGVVPTKSKFVGGWQLSLPIVEGQPF
jgi:hypothetical protein